MSADLCFDVQQWTWKIRWHVHSFACTHVHLISLHLMPFCSLGCRLPSMYLWYDVLTNGLQELLLSLNTCRLLWWFGFGGYTPWPTPCLWLDHCSLIHTLVCKDSLDIHCPIPMGFFEPIWRLLTRSTAATPCTLVLARLPVRTPTRCCLPWLLDLCFSCTALGSVAAMA